MKNYLISSLLFTVFVFTNAASVRAENIAISSAALSLNNSSNVGYDYRTQNLRKFLLKYNSPLADYADEFVAYADKNDLDYRLVPAITGVESTFGKHIPVNSYNAYGWANGDYRFESWEDSIAHVSEVLKTKYFDKGADSIYEIARIYAPPSTTWGSKVTYFVNKIDTLPLNFDII